MSNLTNSEKRNFETFLGMSSGYVLSFSDRTFAEFVAGSTSRNIFDPRYNYASGSKANRLRAFWTTEDNQVVGKLMSDMLDYACEGVRTGALAKECRRTVERLLQDSPGTQPRTKVEASPDSKPTIDAKQYERLAAVLNEVMQLPPNPRGFAFERFLDETFAVFNLAPRKSFRLVGEQIDGSFHLAGATYLVEAKWQDPQIGNRELQAFAGSVRTKAIWSRGLYISYSGFSEDGLTAFGRGDATRIICLDGLELWQIIQNALDLSEVLSLKTRRAAETGRAYVPVRDLFQIR
jgi:hypothetical protein